MPFGHKNAPAVFQAMMQNILHDLIYCVCFVYIDDVIIYGKDEQECIDNTRRVLELIYEDNLKCNALKCEFLLRRVEILGHVIEDGKLFAKVDKL
jgi:predicted RNase H-like HicB family nuclease